MSRFPRQTGKAGPRRRGCTGRSTTTWRTPSPRSLGSTPAGASLALNWLIPLITGVFWYGQFYNLGHVRMGTYKFTRWAIHVIMPVLISNVVGVFFKKWTGVRPRTQAAITVRLLVLMTAVLLLTYGNYPAENSPG